MRNGITATLALAAFSVASPALAFTHVVRVGETLALLAERFYGDARRETVLVGANALDTQGGTVITAGMRLEIPAPGHHTVVQGEVTWADLALTWLGTNDMARTELLAHRQQGRAMGSRPSKGKRSRSPRSSRTSPARTRR